MQRVWRSSLSPALGITLLVGVHAATAAPPPPPVLTETGARLQERYAAALTNLQAAVAKAIPSVDPEKRAALQAARQAMAEARDRVAAAQAPLKKISNAEALVGHAKGKWIGNARKGIAEAERKQKEAANDAEREAAQKERASWQANLEAGEKALVERQAALEAAKADEERHIRENQAAKVALKEAETGELAAARAVLADLEPILAGDSLDTFLVKGAVLAQATPGGLAAFAQQGSEQEALIEKLLDDHALMKAMLEAGGAKGNRWGEAIRIHTGIQKATSRAGEGILQRLALGTSLEHAVPIGQRNAAIETNAPAIVDPVKRYLHYEKAFLDGELDPYFPSMSAWECRMIVNSYAPDHNLAWGREMLRNYRPDHILTTNYGWRYSGIVRTDIAYRHSQEYQDTRDLQFFQNVIKNGGICGRRAFFGRYICKSFGQPTWGVAQHAHAALGRWTPSGWVVNFGAGWESSWGPPEEAEPGRRGTDFLLEAQARKQAHDYWRVLRAQWVGDTMNEPRYDSTKEGSGGFWSVLALLGRKLIVADAKPAVLAALGTELGEANESAAAKAAAVTGETVAESDTRVVTSPDGTMTIPAAVCSGGNPLVKSFLGGQQAIWAAPLSFEVEAPAAGRYRLTGRVVTVHGEASAQLTVNSAEVPRTLAIPFTVGAWQHTGPVDLALTQGRNVLRFAAPSSSLALKDFTLTPLRNR